jgi:hypothetical protein
VATIPAERLVFLDESGVTTSMTRLYARGEGGGRIYEATPGSRWKIATIIGAMSLRGMIATMTIEEATDGDIFRAYVQEVLCAALKPGDVAVMDNLSSHKVSGVRQMIEKAGAEVLCLPPLLARSEAHRKGLVEAQATAPYRQGKNQGSTRRSYRQSSRTYPPGERRRVVQTLHQRSIAFPKML